MLSPGNCRKQCWPFKFCHTTYTLTKNVPSCNTSCFSKTCFHRNTQSTLNQNLYFRANIYYASYFRTVFFIIANRIAFKQLCYHIKPSTAEHFSPALYKNHEIQKIQGSIWSKKKSQKGRQWQKICHLLYVQCRPSNNDQKTSCQHKNSTNSPVR